MKRRDLMATVLMATVAVSVRARSLAGASPAVNAGKTRWHLRTSEGFDALCFLGPLSGDAFYADYYREELQEFVPRLGARTLTRIRALYAAVKQAGGLIGPSLCLLLSGGEDGSIAQVLQSLANPEGRLRSAFAASPFWDADQWSQFMQVRAEVAGILADIKAAGFARFREGHIAARERTRIAHLKQRLSGVDAVGADEKLLGRKLSGADVEVILLYFSQPHGVRIQGQRFLTYIDYPDEIVIRNAIHELMHPSYDRHDPQMREVLAFLGNDPLIVRIVAEANPGFGYSELPAYLDEDVVQTLEQFIAEKSGVALEARARWRAADGGMHVLAAGLYGLLRAENYEQTGGNITAWLHARTKDGTLAPGPLHAAAAQVLGLAPDALWPAGK